MMYKTKFPKLTDLELTNNCNLACPICTENNRKKGEMSLSFLEKILKTNQKILKNTSIWLHFRGEPLLYKNLFKAIKLLDKYSVKGSFSTNGILLSDNIIDKIVDSNINRIVVSAITNKKNDYIKLRGKNTLELVKKNILNLNKKLKENKSKIKLQVMGLNYGQDESEINDFIEQYKKLGIEVSIHNYSTRTGETKTIYNKENVFREINREPCHWLFRKIGILWDGTIDPCCYDMEGKVFGTLNIKDYNYDLLNIWNSNIYKNIRKEHNKGIFKGNCAKCIDWRYEHPNLSKNESNWITIYK